MPEALRKIRTTRRTSLLLAVFAVAGLAACSSPSRMTGGPVAVVAHRGASGVLPEHTLAGYAAAFAYGADYIEPDVVMTRDGVLVCSHDVDLGRTTDAAAIFPDRADSEGEFPVTAFTLDEVRRLSRTGRMDTGSPSGDAPWTGHPVPTFEDTVRLVERLNAGTGRRVGLVPEIKAPSRHREAGLDPTASLVDTLRRHGLDGPDDPVWVQCFDHNELRRLRDEFGYRGRLVALTGSDVPSDAELAEFATFADAIGPSRKAIEDEDGRPLTRPTLVERAHAAGLAVIPYTFKNEPDAFRRFMDGYQVDGLFTDFTDAALRARD